MKPRRKSRLQWFELPPYRKVRGGAHLSNRSKQRLVGLLHSGVPLEMIPEILQNELREDPERVERYIWSVHSRMKNQKKSRRDPAFAPANIAALMRWTAVMVKEQRRKNVAHSPNSAPHVQAFINKADQISNADGSSSSMDETEQEPAAGTSSCGDGGSGGGGSPGKTQKNAMHFTLANMYRYMVQASEDHEPPCTDLMAALLRLFTERLLVRLEVAQQGPDGKYIEELIRLLRNKGETIANLQVRASDRVYWSGQGRPPPGWDPKAYTDAIYNPPTDATNLNADTLNDHSGQGQEADDDSPTSGEGSAVPTGGLLSKAVAVANLLQIPVPLLRKVAEVLSASIPPPTAYAGNGQGQSAWQQQSHVDAQPETAKQAPNARNRNDSAGTNEMVELVVEFKHGQEQGQDGTMEYLGQEHVAGDDGADEDDYSEVVLVRVE